jgi:predicted metalloprotease
VRWKRVRGQGDIEDRRGQGGGMFGGGGGLPIPMGKGAGGLGIIIAIVAALLLGPNVLGGGDDGSLSPGSGLEPSAPAQPSGEASRRDDTVFEFTKFVGKDTQDVWTKIFRNANRAYTRAPVVTFTSGTSTGGCGSASSATGPFYCPADNKVYLDLSFFQELSQRFGAPGDFAVAYVIAHEVGHHVQTLLGIESAVRRRQQEDPGNANQYLVQLELQADCFAGVWAHSTYERNLLEEGDVEEGLAAAAAVGDDRLGARSPEQWTHGSSRLRTEWFRQGFESGDPNDCDTSHVEI